MNNSKSFIDRVFGEEVGSAIKMFLFILIFFAFPFIFVAIPKFFMNKSKDKAEIYKDIPKDTDSLVSQILIVRKQTDDLLNKLQADINTSVLSIEKKKEELEGLQRKHEMLKLTPDQLAVIQKYNLTVSNEDPSFSNWISKKATIYNLITGVLISLLFFLIGIWYEKRKLRRKSA